MCVVCVFMCAIFQGFKVLSSNSFTSRNRLQSSQWFDSTLVALIWIVSQTFKMRKVLFLLFFLFICAETDGFMDNARNRLKYNEPKNVQHMQGKMIQSEDERTWEDALGPKDQRDHKRDGPVEINSVDSMDNKVIVRKPWSRNLLSNEDEDLSSFNSTFSITTKTTTAKTTSSPSTTKATTAKSITSFVVSTIKTTIVKTTVRTSTGDLHKGTFPELCQNGGIYDGAKCICNEDLSFGPKCEFLMDDFQVPELSVTINVKAQLRVTNKEYNNSLEDLSSDYSREIQDQFKKQMEVVYRDIPGYFDVKILQMRKGSIIVEHRVIFQVQVENNEEIIQKQMNTITDEVRNSLAEIGTNGECVRNSGPKLCFVPLPNPILNSTVSLNDPCKNIIDPKYAYYYPYQLNGTVRCVSRCFKGTPDSMNCFNGICRVSEIGPHCICNNLDMFWYLDSYCHLAIQKSVLGLSLALAVFIVISIILVICLIKAKWKKSRNSWSDDADYDKIGKKNPIFLE